MERFQRLDRFPYAGPADAKFFRQLFLGRQALARLHLFFFDEFKNIVDDLGGNRLSADQANTSRADSPKARPPEHIITLFDFIAPALPSFHGFEASFRTSSKVS